MNATELITDAIIDFSSKSNYNDDDTEKLVIIDTDQDLSKKKSFAELSLPSQFLIRNGSVFTTTIIPPMTLLGPLQGKAILEKDITDDNDLKHVWLVQGKDKQRFFISTEDADKSNWLRFVKPAPCKESKNLVIVYKDDSLYFVTNRSIQINEELLFWSDDPSITWTSMSAGLSVKTNCGGCQFVSDHHLYYRLHLLIAHDPQFAKFHCKVCAMPFCDSENLIKHALNNHEGKGTYKCELCKKVKK